MCVRYSELKGNFFNCAVCLIKDALYWLQGSLIIFFLQMRPVIVDDFDAALNTVKASVSEKDLDLYLDWNKLFGCGK